MIIEKTDRTIEFNVEYDVLDAAIHRCLSGTVRGFVIFEREELTRATIVYLLSQHEIGVFGKIRIDKRGNEQTKMSLFEFREPFDSNEKKKTHYKNFVDMLLNKLGEENIWTKKQKDFQTVKRTEIHIYGDVNDSNIITGKKNKLKVKATQKAQKGKNK
jgi:hypothetical protein